MNRNPFYNDLQNVVYRFAGRMPTSISEPIRKIMDKIHVYNSDKYVSDTAKVASISRTITQNNNTLSLTLYPRLPQNDNSLELLGDLFRELNDDVNFDYTLQDTLDRHGRCNLLHLKQTIPDTNSIGEAVQNIQSMINQYNDSNSIPFMKICFLDYINTSLQIYITLYNFVTDIDTHTSLTMVRLLREDEYMVLVDMLDENLYEHRIIFDDAHTFNFTRR